MLTLRIKQRIQETPDTITLVFDLPAYSFHYEAGQFITLHITLKGEIYRRSYSLCTSPYKDPFPAITIKRVKGGKISNYLHEQVNKGDMLQAFPPQGRFIIEYAPHLARHFCFIAGGSGITPLFSMIKALLQQEPRSQLDLIYASKREEEIIYREALKEMVQKNKHRLRVVHCLSTPTPSQKGIKGRLTSARLLQLTSSLPQDTLYYLCGPTGLMKMAKTSLEGIGIPSQQIHQERFDIASPSPKEPNQAVHAQVTFCQDGMKATCEVLPGETLLDAALDAGIDIPYSCTSGMCNMCRAKCVKGTVHMLTDEGLSEEEKAEGYVLTCVGHPTTPEVELELD